MTLRKSMFAYGCNSCAFSLLSTTFSLYYIKVFLKIYKIEEHWFQTAQLLYLVWNALNDPLFAYLQESSSTKFTRTRRESILYCSPLFALSFLLPWLTHAETPWLVGVHLIVTLLLWDSMFTFVGLAACCLFTEISEDPAIRLKLVRIGNIGSLIGSTTVFIVEFTSNSLKNFVGFQITTICIAVCSCLLFQYAGFNAHTHYDRMQQKQNLDKDAPIAAKNIHNSSYWTLTKQIFRQGDFVAFVATNFLQEFHRAFLSGFLIIFCDHLVPSDQVPVWIRSSFYGAMPVIPMILVICGMPVISKIGYFKVIQMNFVCKITISTALFIMGRNHPWFLMSCLLLDSCFTNASFSLYNMPLSDIADQNMRIYSRSHPISSMIFGSNALVVKPAISLSPMLVVAILNRYGYAESTKKTLDESKLPVLQDAMFNLLCVIPFVLGLIQMFTWSRYSMKENKTLKTQNNEIEIQV